jgi:hypothetical protein
VAVGRDGGKAGLRWDGGNVGLRWDSGIVCQWDSGTEGWDEVAVGQSDCSVMERLGRWDNLAVGRRDSGFTWRWVVGQWTVQWCGCWIVWLWDSGIVEKCGNRAVDKGDMVVERSDCGDGARIFPRFPD